MENLPKGKAVKPGPQGWAGSSWEKEDSITALGLEFRNSGDSRKGPHTTDVLKTKRSEKVEGMIGLTELGMPGGKSG